MYRETDRIHEIMVWRGTGYDKKIWWWRAEVGSGPDALGNGGESSFEDALKEARICVETEIERVKRDPLPAATTPFSRS